MFRALLAAAIALSQPAALEQQVQRLAASFISNFPAYVTWPERAWLQGGERIYIGILGENFLGSSGVRYLEAHNYEGRLFEVHLLRQYTRDQVDRYQMLIVGEMPQKELKKLLKETSQEPILTIGIDPNFNQLGGIIQLQIEGKAVTWRVDLDHAKKAGLKIDPRLLKYGQSM